MNKRIKNILRCYAAGIGIKETASTFHISRNTVRKYVRLFLSSGKSIEQLLSLPNGQLDELFGCTDTRHREPSSKRIELEALLPGYVSRLSRKGMSVRKLFKEYHTEYPDGYQLSSFKRIVSEYRFHIKVVGHVEHYAAEQMYIDFAGDRLEVVDEMTGETKKAEVFVAILPFSHYTYCEAVWSQRKEDLIKACENAIQYFEGVPAAIVPDNLKAAVTRSDRNEPVINDDFAAFAEYYTVLPQYREVFDLCADRAAVRFEDGRTGVVDKSGVLMVVTDRCRRLRFLKGELLSVTKEDGSDCYTDLKTNRTYQERPVVFSYGGIELLRVGETFHSRTRKAYASMHGLHKDSLCFYGFYLNIPDYRVPKSCRLVDPVWSAIFDVFACVLEGDDEEVYWCCGCLADRSIVVMDGEGSYYHVEKGKGKRYIACNVPKAGEADFASVVEGLRKEAGRRAESVQRERQQNEEEKRRKRLEEIKDVLPFRMGMKWGLKWGDRIVVPPCYRNICVPVGGYCAFEGNACQWGVMALDGKVVVEARYQKVEIEKDGTVHLTIIPGKVKTINL